MLVNIAYYAFSSAHFLSKLCSNYARFSKLCHLFFKLFRLQNKQNKWKNATLFYLSLFMEALLSPFSHLFAQDSSFVLVIFFLFSLAQWKLPNNIILYHIKDYAHYINMYICMSAIFQHGLWEVMGLIIPSTPTSGSGKLVLTATMVSQGFLWTANVAKKMICICFGVNGSTKKISGLPKCVDYASSATF